MPADPLVVADALAYYGPVEHRKRMGVRLRASQNKARPHLVVATHQLTKLDIEFLDFAARNEGVSRAEYLRRIIAIDRMAWTKAGLFQASRKQ